MSANPPSACRNAASGCPGYAVKSGLCPKCLAADAPPPNNEPIKLRWKTPGQAKTEVDLWYHRAPWQKFIKALKAYNSICQVIDAHGVRCTNPSKVGHHIESPYTSPSKFLSPQNVVCICAQHHTPDEGEAQDANRTFAPTKWLFGSMYEHKRPEPRKPGDVVIGENGVAL
jgi:hypothetical protein